MSKQMLRNVVGRTWPCLVTIVVALAALALFATGGQSALAAQGIIYVDAEATGNNDGSSWDDAYTDLQPALAAAVAGEQIWVAEGTYKPTWQFDTDDPRSAAFQMKNGVGIYGGFDPGEGAFRFKDRDWVLYETILSGDIGTPGDSSDNSYHVFYHAYGMELDGSAVLDGFTIHRGNANGAFEPHYWGGGMYNEWYSSPTLANCTFTGNSAIYKGGAMYNYAYSAPTLTNCTFSGNSADEFGGGMFNDFSSPTLTDCTFTGNSAREGGGMFNYYTSSPTLDNCTFSGNSASGSGGGMSNIEGASPGLTNCTFTGNSASYQGGGMYNVDGSSPMLTNCTFSGNSAHEGGGMYNEWWAWPTLTNCTFSANSAISGGGMLNYGYCLPMLTGCTFTENSADEGGGMSNVKGASPGLTNCTFAGNSASGSGGGMFNDFSSPGLTNCTFTGNSAQFDGGGMYNHEPSSPTLTNCIFWKDTAGGLADEICNYNSTPVVTYSDVQGGYVGVGNINADPLFADPANGDYHLQSGSPCIDAGDNEAPSLPPYDFEGDPRFLDGDGNGAVVVDMGVDEYSGGGSSTIEVEIDITPKTPNNIIKLSPSAKVEVAILTTGDFDASTVDPLIVWFAGAEQRGWTLDDVDGDGDDDLLLSFYLEEMVDLTLSSKTATLTGYTKEIYGLVPIEGTDRVKVKE